MAVRKALVLVNGTPQQISSSDSLVGVLASDSISKTANYTVVLTDAGKVIECNASSAAFTITLPAASSASGQIFTIRKTDASVNDVSVTCNGSDTIFGISGYLLRGQGASITLASTGSAQWVVVGSANATQRAFSFRTVTFSAIEPTNKFPGDLWYEASAGGSLLYGWAWTWNGTYWLSPDQYWDFDHSAISATTTRYLAPNGDFNYYFSAWRSTMYVATTNNASNYWFLDLTRATAAAAVTTISTGPSTAANTVNNYVTQSQAIGTHVDTTATSAKVFVANLNKVNAPGVLYAGVTIVYNYARK